MANTNPDIELVVGVDSGNSYTTMKDGINQVLRDIEGRNPPKIKIQLDDAEINSKIQSLRNQITDLNNQKLSIDTNSIKQAGEDSAKNIVTNFEQAYDYITNRLKSPRGASILMDFKTVLEQNIELANEFYSALSRAVTVGAVNQLIIAFDDLRREELDVVNTANRFKAIIADQFKIDVPSVESFKRFHEYTSDSIQSLTTLRQSLASVIGVPNDDDKVLSVTLQQLQSVVDKAPMAQKYIDEIVSSFRIPYREVSSDLGNIEATERSLQTQTERLGETMNNAITLDTFNSKLSATNESIGQVSGSISTLAKNISSVLSKSADNTMLNVNPDALKVVEELLRGIYNIANGIDMSKVINEISKVGDAASGTKAKISAIGESVTKSTINVSKIKEMLSTKDLDASVARVTDRFEKLGNSGATGLGKIKTDIAQINTLLASLKSTQVLSNDNDLLGTYQKLSTLLETVRNKISIIESRTNTAKKINFGIDTAKFKTDMDLIQRDFDKLKGSTSILATNLGELHTAFTVLEGGSSTQEQRVAAYEKLKALIPVVRQQVKVQANEEKAAMQANNKAIREATLESKKQNAIEEKANTQRRIALDLLAKITKAQQEWTKAQNGKTSNEYAQLQNYSNQLTTLLNQLANYSMPKANFTAQVKSINDEFARTSSVIRSAGEDTKSLKDRFGALTGTFSMWFSTTRIIMMVYSNIRKMISASIELDKSMTQLQIVTKENDETMTKFGNTAANTARKIGSSITDFTSSVTTFARLGYSIGESSQLAEFTAMLQNVGDIDVSEAQEAITSIVKAFNIGTDQIESVMDKMVVSGNNFPISVSQIAEGMKNASSALAAAGNSFDQSVALLTAANSTLQDSAKSSTGLRTIAARIRRTKTELDDLGETISEAEYEKLIKALTDMNVTLTENGEYRSTYDIIKDIAAQWKNLTSMEQAALTEALAGTRQQSVFSGLVNNFQEASGAMEAMAGSAGELRESYATYMESAEAHINQLKAAFESLAQSLFNSDSIKTVVDMLAGLLTTLDNLVRTIGGVPTIITGIAAAMSAFGNVGRGKQFPLNKYADSNNSSVWIQAV